MKHSLGIAAGLAIEWRCGVSPVVLVTSGILLFLVANLLRELDKERSGWEELKIYPAPAASR